MVRVIHELGNIGGPREGEAPQPLRTWFKRAEDEDELARRHVFALRLSERAEEVDSSALKFAASALVLSITALDVIAHVVAEDAQGAIRSIRETKLHDIQG